jgi:hypothetical protein
MPEMAKLTVRIFDGRRLLISNPSNIRVRIFDGDQKEIWNNRINVADQPFMVPFYDGPRDMYRVIVSKPGWTTAGCYPVKVSQTGTQVVDLMIIPERHRVNPLLAQFAALQQSHPAYCDIMCALDEKAPSRWDALLNQENALVPIDYLNLLTAMRTIHLESGKTPFDYLRAADWSRAPQEDRFWVWVDKALVDDVVETARTGGFDQEPDPKVFHKDATLSYKENLLSEANVQLTFLANAPSPREFPDCVLMEPDIDYYPNLLAHGLLEVVPGFFSRTDPRMAYILRWMSARRAGLPEFDPPFTLDAV